VPDELIAYLSNLHPGEAHLGSFYGQLYEHDVSPINRLTLAYDISTWAFHFDAKLAADYLEKVALALDNCTLIDKKIQSAHIGDQGLMTAVVLEDGQRVEADFFIDATGFARLLIKEFDHKWVSYRQHLPVNTALPFLQNHEPGELTKSYSLALAQSSGWYWELPSQHRRGSGYVFSDDFITVDQAQAEIETTLGKKVDPIKVIKFDSGRLENSWIKNCYAVGLASAFAEPLEATSIHSTIQSLVHLSHEYIQPTIEDTINPASIRLCNQRVNRMYDDFKDFISSHYQGGRTDSEFWKYMTHDRGAPTDFARDLKEMCASRMPTKFDFPNYPGAAGWPIWCYILLGTGQLRPGVTAKYLNSDSMARAGYHLNRLNKFAENAKMTHYSFQQHLDVVKNNAVKFIPRQGQELYLGS
jgi:tryptophan halogenase